MPLIVIYGAPLVGKTTLIRSLLSDYCAKVSSFRTPPDEASGISDIGLTAVFKSPHSAEPFEFLTFPGAPWASSVWLTPLSRADAMILVLDPQPDRREVVRKSLAELKRFQARPGVGCVLLTKLDKLDAADDALVIELLAGSAEGGWPVFHSRNDQPETLLAPLRWILEQACASPATNSRKK